MQGADMDHFSTIKEADMDHFSAINTFIKSADYLTKPVKKRASAAFGMSRRKDYTSEEKLFFVNLVVEGGNSKASVAKQYDIPESTLRGWCKPKHKDKLEKEAQERKAAPNVFDTPSPSSSSSSAGSGVNPASLYHQYKDSSFDHHPIPTSGIVPTLTIPKVDSLFYPQSSLRCRTGLIEPRPLIKEEREEEVLNLTMSSKTDQQLSSPILTQCLNVPTSVSESSIKSMQHMKHALLDSKSPNNLLDIQQNMNSMFTSYAKSPHPPCTADKLSPKPSNPPSPVQYKDETSVNKRKYDAFVNETKDSSPDKHRKESQNNNSEFYKNYEQFLNNKRASEKESPKPEPTAPPMNHYFKNYLESMVMKAQQNQKLPGAHSPVPPAPEPYKLAAAQQLWLQQLALNQLAASQLPAQQQQQTAAALQQQQMLYERQMLNARLSQQAATNGGAQPEGKLFTWTSQLHANQRELEEKLKLLIQTQQQILKDKSQSPENLYSPDHDRVKRLRTMNVRDILESHRQSKSHDTSQSDLLSATDAFKSGPMELRRARPSEDSDVSLSRSEEKSSDEHHSEEEMCVRTIEEDAAKSMTLDLSKTESQRPLLDLSKAESRPIISARDFARERESPLSRLPSPKPNGYDYLEERRSPFNSDREERHAPYNSTVGRHFPYNSNVEERQSPYNSTEERHSPYRVDTYDTKPVELDENHLDLAIHHGERFLEDLEKVSHPKLTLQHIRQVRDLLCKLKTPVFENNNMKEMDESSKSKRKSLLNIVHNLTN